MQRRALLALAVAQAARGIPRLTITAVEPVVLRTPNTGQKAESLIDPPRFGSHTGGPGLANRLDHASPVRYFGVQQAVLVKITTDQGLIGWGECHAPGSPRVHAAIITDLLAPVLTGQDARHVEPLWERMYSANRTRGYSTGFVTEAIAGCDLALWDLLGKFTNQPVWQLLGGKFRDRIPAYTSAGSVEQALKAFELGFTAVKMSFGKGTTTRDLDRVKAVSQAIGAKGQLLLDSLGAFKLSEAQALGHQLDALGNIGWWEDPLLPEEVSGFAALAAQCTTPICAGEELSNRFQFRDYFAARACDIINPDLCRAGGITECRRIAAMADAEGILWSPHVSTGTALYMSASTQLAAATSNSVILEGGRAHEGPFGNVLLREPLVYTPGFAHVPDRPGLGVEFNDQQLKKVTVS